MDMFLWCFGKIIHFILNTTRTNYIGYLKMGQVFSCRNHGLGNVRSPVWTFSCLATSTFGFHLVSLSSRNIALAGKSIAVLRGNFQCDWNATCSSVIMDNALKSGRLFCTEFRPRRPFLSCPKVRTRFTFWQVEIFQNPRSTLIRCMAS